MASPARDLETLTESEALELAGTADVGRIALVEAGDILVVPLNFALLGRDVLLRTAEDTALLRAARQDAAATFQVDELEQWSHSGWSVQVAGRLCEVTDADQVREVLQDVVAWSGGTRDSVVRLVAGRVTGRRIRPGPGGTSIIYI